MPSPIAPCGVGLLFAGCVLLNGSDARAQVSGAFMDAFAPKLQAPGSAPRFQKYDRDELAKLARQRRLLLRAQGRARAASIQQTRAGPGRKSKQKMP
jgi:hypothetical protein